MAITVTSIKCPECGAALSVEEGRTQMFCSYCGTKILLTNENEHIYRHIDEADLRRAETDSAERMHKIKMAEKGSSFQTLFTIVWLIITLILIFVAVYIMLFRGSEEGEGGLEGFLFLFYVCAPIIIGGAYLIFKVIPEKENNKSMLQSGGIRFPKGLEPFSEQNYQVVCQALNNAGFTNITCINLHDLSFGIITKPYKIESITVNGEKITSGGRVYMPNAHINISYHGKE